jgi:hypothetical protein
VIQRKKKKKKREKCIRKEIKKGKRRLLNIQVLLSSQGLLITSIFKSKMGR